MQKEWGGHNWADSSSDGQNLQTNSGPVPTFKSVSTSCRQTGIREREQEQGVGKLAAWLSLDCTRETPLLASTGLAWHWVLQGGPESVLLSGHFSFTE